nr:MAG TPA: hypothetical protein [Inoviridae sp.]
MIDYLKVVTLFATGFACGHVLSVIPLACGALIGFAINLMKGDT